MKSHTHTTGSIRPRPGARMGHLALALALGAAAAPAQAHFLELIPSADVLPEGGALDLALVFSHPFDGGPVMDMARPQALYLLQNGTRQDLSASLRENPAENGAMRWTARADLPEPGAALIAVEPQPYWEAAEGKYIRHYTKVVVDSFASGAGWDQLAGLPVEILPLTRPSGLWAGNSFRGIVTRAGQPVPHAEIEVEFINDTGIRPPNEAFITQVIRADAQGSFSYTMPRAGWWGFAALLEAETPIPGPDGRPAPVEEGALIWVKTYPMQED